jgi:glycyl-tRNA synthetase beta chain
MGELLLELLSEEIPARMQRRAIEDLKRHLDEWLQAQRIRGTESIQGYVTPRRLTVIADGIPERQPPQKEERRGPRVGSPPQAVEGFLRGAGIVSIEQCEVRATDRGEFYFAVIERPGRAAADALPDLIHSTIWDVGWPKSMRYSASALPWVRPLTSVLCLFNGQVLPVPLNNIPVGRTTRGHRWLSPGEICVASANDYFDRLRQAHVVLDQDRRRETILKGLEAAVAAEGVSLKEDSALLDEVTGLVEYPVVLAGSIDADFMALPPEVLATAMRAHQKYFSCLRPDGTPAPRFLMVADNLAADDGKTIVAGNERVLRARLADARFFWDQDRRVRLESRVEALADRVFHAKLGSLRDKVARMEKLVDFLVPHVPGADVLRSRRAVRLVKADLSTGMVGEFPELQGAMGRYYALHDGEDERVANAIAEHYKPLGPNDACPTAPESVVVSLADKIDSLVAFFSIGEKPSGSRDPYALRRAALGVIRLILENRLRLPLTAALEHAVDTLAAQLLLPDPSEELLAFIADRLKVHLRGEGFGYAGEVKLTRLRHDLIAAVFALAEDDFVRLLARAAELAGFLATDDGANLLVAYRRASNIVALEEKRDNRRYDGEVDPVLLRQPEEEALADQLGAVSALAGTLLSSEKFSQAMSELARLRRSVDDFFDKVTVNCQEPALRENRLRLLAGITQTMNRVADFSQIEG